MRQKSLLVPISIGFVLAACSPSPAPESCGNAVCVAAAGETCSTCRADCGSCAACGNGACQDSETCRTCPMDCGACACGDGTCAGGETCSTCPMDCGACTVDAGGSPDAGGSGCEIQAGRWVGSGVPTSGTDPLCTTQSFDMRLASGFLEEVSSWAATMCSAACTCTSPFATLDPPGCFAGVDTACAPPLGLSDYWQRVSPTQLERITSGTTDRGDCSMTWTITWTGP